MHLNDWIIEELKAVDFSTSITEDLYKELLPKFGVHYKYESFSRHVRRVRQRYFEQNPQEIISRNIVDAPSEDQEVNIPDVPETKSSMNVQGNSATFSVSSDVEVKNIETLIRDCGIDTTVWRVNKHTVNRWETLIKTENGYEKKPIYQVKGHLDKILPDETLWPVVKSINMPTIKRAYKTHSEFHEKGITRNYLIIADTQIGFNRTNHTELETFHDRKAMDSVLKLLEDHTFDTIIVNGDILDLASMSRFTQKKEFTDTVQPTLQEAGWYFEQLRRLAPHSEIVYTASNHDDRFNRYIMENMQVAYGLKAYGQKNPLFSLENLLALDKIDVKFIDGYPGGSYWIRGKDDKPLIKVHHGEFVSIDKELAVTNVSSIFGHVHQIATKCKTYHGDKGPETVIVATSGCLCKIDGTVPGAVSRPSWQQGIIHVEVAPNDHYAINQLPINDGKLIYKGESYQGEEYSLDFS